MDWILYIVAFAFFLLGAGCLILVVVGLPGGWIMLGLAGVIEYADQYYLTADSATGQAAGATSGGQTFDWWVLGACLGLLLIAEGIEFFAGVAGAKKGGASRRGMVGALIGGLVGVFVFTPLFWFVPVVGTIFGALAGTFAGAMVGEMTGQDATMSGSVKPAFGATVGRVVGTASKLGFTIAIWLVLTVSAFIH